MHEAQTDSSSSILSIGAYTPQALRQFFNTNHAASSYKYEAYIKRRRAGGPRELFPTYEYAAQWLKLAACVKYVDGGWVGNILNFGLTAMRPAGSSASESESGSMRVPAASEREAAKLAWQVVTEEFGDGDLAKNHVYLYYELIHSLDPSALPGHMRGFDGLQPDQGSYRCWTAAIAQQCIGLMAGTDDFFPEALGFNMAYETLPYHLLVTSKELRELKVDDYYFALHITIDNPDSGHAALGRLAVETLLEGVRQRDGDEAMQKMWKRVQAGCVLADGLPTTPASPIEHERLPNGRWAPKTAVSPVPTQPCSPASSIERAMVHLLTRKALAAEKMHCSSRIRIDGWTVEEWLDATTWTDKKGLEFLRALGRKQPWVVPGDSKQSRLVRELEWGGRMFGAFSAKETDLVRRWIVQLGNEGGQQGRQGAYERFVGDSFHLHRQETGKALALERHRFAYYASQQLLDAGDADLLAVHQRLARGASDSTLIWTDLCSTAEAKPLNLPLIELAAIWLTIPSLFEQLPLSPSKLASPLGMCALRILRSFSGFPDLHAPETICAGMDHYIDDADMDNYQHLADDETTGLTCGETMGWHEIGTNIFIDIKVNGTDRRIASFDLPRIAAQVRPDSHIAQMCADMLVLRSKPYAHAEILLGMTLAGVLRTTASVLAQMQMQERDEVILRRIRSEVITAIQEHIEWERERAGYEDVSEGFTQGFEMVMRA